MSCPTVRKGTKVTVDREALGSVIAVINGKGGVGKTTVASNLAGKLASAGYWTLAVDMDPSGNLGSDLGYMDSDLDDAGENLMEALTKPRVHLKPVKGIRDHLDVVPGGALLHDAQAALAFPNKRRPRPTLKLAEALSEVSGGYDFTILDCPPGSDILQENAIGAARWLIVPVGRDSASRKGLYDVADRIANVADINESVSLLGVVLLGVATNETVIRANVRDRITEVLGDDKYHFDTFIRHTNKVSQDAREAGALVHEIEAKSGKGTASAVADDFHALTAEVLKRITAWTEEDAQ